MIDVYKRVREAGWIQCLGLLLASAVLALAASSIPVLAQVATGLFEAPDQRARVETRRLATLADPLGNLRA